MLTAYLALASGCVGGSSDTGGTPDASEAADNGVVPDAAVAGTEGAPCYPNGACNAGLECSAESVCIAAVVAGVVCFGDFAISNSLDLEALIEANCEQLTGTLSLSLNGYPWPLELPGLTRVGGLRITNLEPEFDLGLPELVSIGESGLSLSANMPRLPLLASVTGDLYINNTTALTSISLPLLASVGGDLSIGGNAALTSISLPALASVGGHLIMHGNAALTELSLPALVSVDADVTMSSHAALTSISLPLLASVGRDLDRKSVV